MLGLNRIEVGCEMLKSFGTGYFISDTSTEDEYHLEIVTIEFGDDHLSSASSARKQLFTMGTANFR